jgi:hypothetical protein
MILGNILLTIYSNCPSSEVISTHRANPTVKLIFRNAKGTRVRSFREPNLKQVLNKGCQRPLAVKQGIGAEENTKYFLG